MCKVGQVYGDDGNKTFGGKRGVVYTEVKIHVKLM